MKDKLGIMLGIAVVAMVLVSLALWMFNVDEVGVGEVSLVVIIMLLVGFAMLIVKDKLKSVKEGLPSEDERTRVLSYKAGYYGFIAAIWSAVLGPTVYDIVFDEELVGSHVTAVVVIVGGLAFVISYLVMQSRGGPE